MADRGAVRILLPDLTTDASRRPASLPLLRTTTMLGLRRMGHDPIVGTAKSADLALVDALDTPTAAAIDAIRGLRARGLPVVLRLHGAWNGSQGAKRPHGSGTTR